MYVQCIFMVTKYELADARCTRWRSPPAMQPVQLCIYIYVYVSAYWYM